MTVLEMSSLAHTHSAYEDSETQSEVILLIAGGGGHGNQVPCFVVQGSSICSLEKVYSHT